MFESMLNGLLLTLQWKSMLMIFLAVPIGMFFGAVPGLGGKLGIALCIPFVFGMEPVPGFAFLLGMHSVVHTGGSLPSTLFGTPGTGPDAATIVDGYPMAQSGRGAEALGISLYSGVIGGFLGLLVLVLLTRPLAELALVFTPMSYFALGVL